jgi:pyrroloquinoline quinone biosynthesis protein D
VTALAVPAGAVPRLAPGALVRHDRVRDEDQLLMPERVVRLNASGAAILRACDGHRTVEDIVAALEEQFGAGDLGPEVGAFLADFGGRGWVEW